MLHRDARLPARAPFAGHPGRGNRARRRYVLSARAQACGITGEQGPADRRHHRAVGRRQKSGPLAGQLGVEECCYKLARRVQGKHRFDAAGDDELRHLFWLAADHLTALEPRNDRRGRGADGAGRALQSAWKERSNRPLHPTTWPSKSAGCSYRRVNDRLSITDVARQLGVSPTRAKAAFRKAFDSGIIAYANQLKIWQAKRLLGDLSLTVNQVSGKLGFSSHSYFSQVFFQHTGETPAFVIGMRARRGRMRRGVPGVA